MNDFERGILYAVQSLVIDFDKPTIARHIVKESGFPVQTFIKLQRESEYESEKMLRFFKTNF